MKESEFKEKYWNLTGLLSGFVIQCYEDVSDEVVIEENSIEAIQNLLPQAHEVLSLDPFPAEAIELITNIWHENQSTKEWFAEIVGKLEKRVREAEKEE